MDIQGPHRTKPTAPVRTSRRSTGDWVNPASWPSHYANVALHSCEMSGIENHKSETCSLQWPVVALRSTWIEWLDTRRSDGGWLKIHQPIQRFPGTCCHQVLARSVHGRTIWQTSYAQNIQYHENMWNMVDRIHIIIILLLLLLIIIINHKMILLMDWWFLLSSVSFALWHFLCCHFSRSLRSKLKSKSWTYCWWKKSCISWYGKYPIIYRVYASQVVSRISSINSRKP